MEKSKVLCNDSSGFTLIETIVSVSLLSVIAISASGAFRNGLVAYQRIESELGREHEINMLVRQMNLELRNAIPYAEIPFEGESDRITFPARLWEYDKKGFKEDLYEVVYQYRGRMLEREQRKLKKTFSEDGKEEKEKLLAFETCKFQFAYKNSNGGVEWRNEWSDNRYLGLPRGIRLTLVQPKTNGRRSLEKVFDLLIPHGVLGEVT